MVIRSNISALNAHRNIKNTGLQQRQAANRLSSGFRINSAADDAAGLAISENMRAQIRGLNQAFRNTQDGIALIQTTEGAMAGINDILTRVRELIVQAANDTNTIDQRRMIQQEIDQLLNEINCMTYRTEFNSTRVLGCSLAGVRFPRPESVGLMASVDPATQLANNNGDLFFSLPHPSSNLTLHTTGQIICPDFGYGIRDLVQFTHPPTAVRTTVAYINVEAGDSLHFLLLFTSSIDYIITSPCGVEFSTRELILYYYGTSANPAIPSDPRGASDEKRILITSLVESVALHFFGVSMAGQWRVELENVNLAITPNISFRRHTHLNEDGTRVFPLISGEAQRTGESVGDFFFSTRTEPVLFDT